MSRCRNVPVPKRPYAKLPHTTKTLCQKVFKQKCPQRQNIYVPECPWNRKVPIAKQFCDDLSVPKFLLPKCQEPKFLYTDELKPQAYIMIKNNLCVSVSLYLQFMANVKAILQFFGNSVFISIQLKIPKHYKCYLAPPHVVVLLDQILSLWLLSLFYWFFIAPEARTRTSHHTPVFSMNSKK